MGSNWYAFDYLHATAVATSVVETDTSQSPPERVIQATSVTAGKSTPAYSAHSYPTKVPPEAIEFFIHRFTEAGDTILDPFCGSGMLGLAALRAGRRPILSDLSPLATHLAYNHTTPCDPSVLWRTWMTLANELQQEVDRHYGFLCTECGTAGRVRYTIWSDVYACPGCFAEVPLWRNGVDWDRGIVPRRVTCPSCQLTWRKTAQMRTRIEPAWAVYTCSCSNNLQRRDLTDTERVDLLDFPAVAADRFVPSVPVSADREMYRRCALHLQGIRNVTDFYTRRNLSALAELWRAIQEVPDTRIRLALAFAFTNTAWHGTRMRRFNARGGHRPLTGTLYIPQLSSEANVFDVMAHKVKQLRRFYTELDRDIRDANSVNLRLSSATDLSWIGDATIDYIFTDPPFGSNIFYADCNIIGEAWLGTVTDTELEAVVNRSKTAKLGGKSVHDYQAILQAAFAEMYRVLKPGRWATVVFQSTEGEIWKSIESAAIDAGFEIHPADILDKVQQSMKGYKGRSGAENVASFDLALILRKNATSSIAQFRSANNETVADLAVDAVYEYFKMGRPDSAANPTLPFLYSLCVQRLLNAGFSLSHFSMGALRRTLATHFDEHDGAWYTRGMMVERSDGFAHRPTADAQSRAGSAM